MKKFLSLVLALIMTMSLVTISAGATEYKDLTDKDEIQYEEAVAVLNRIGVITGYEDGSFRPETELTRGAAAKIIVSLMIGPDAASALPNNASPYPDVPAGHTFAGVIGYCKTAGYISGYGDGTFKPANPLTGYAFAKMLLGAIGYKSNVEGFVDTGWTMNVARIGNVAGLFDRLNFDGAAAVTRDEACQLALNTLKATMVDYGGSNTVVSSSGEVLTVQGSKAQYVTSNNRDINANINRRVISATNNELTLEFGEEHFKDLRLEHDRYDPAYDNYGRPSNEWSYKKVTIGTFPLPADFTFTKQMAHREDTVASKEKALGLRGYDTYSTDHRTTSGYSTVNGVVLGGDPFADATQVTINGFDARVYNSAYTNNANSGTVLNGNLYAYDAYAAGIGKDNAPSLAEICDLTDNGVTVEVYVCPVDADFITNVVVVRTQLMKVKTIGSDYVALERQDPDSKDPRKAGDLNKITGYNAFAIDVDTVDVKDNNYDAYNTLKDMKAGDRVAVVPYTADQGRTWEVGEVYTPETASGTLTKVDLYANTAKSDGNAISLTVGGTNYPISEWNDGMINADGYQIKATKKDVTLYLDKLGNALYADEIGNTDAWIVVGDYYQAANAKGVVDWFVHGWTIKGEEVNLDLGTIRGEAEKFAPGELVYYSLAKYGTGEYKLTKPNFEGKGLYKNSNAAPNDWFTPKTAVKSTTAGDKTYKTGEGIYEISQFAETRSNVVRAFNIATGNTDAALEKYSYQTVNTTTGAVSDAPYAHDTIIGGVTYGSKQVDKVPDIAGTLPAKKDPYNFQYNYTNYDGVKFIFVGFDPTTGEVDTIDFKDGVQNVSATDLQKWNTIWTNVGTNGSADAGKYVVSAAEAYVNDSGKVKAVVIKDDSAEANLSNIAVITDYEGSDTWTRTVGADSELNGFTRKYRVGPKFDQELTGTFDRPYNVGDIVTIRTKGENEVIQAKYFHYETYTNGNPDVLVAYNLGKFETYTGSTNKSAFVVGLNSGATVTTPSGVSLASASVCHIMSEDNTLGDTDLNDEFFMTDDRAGLITVNSETRFVDQRVGHRDDEIDSLDDLLDRDLSKVRVKVLLNGKASTSSFRHAYVVVVMEAPSKLSAPATPKVTINAYNGTLNGTVYEVAYGPSATVELSAVIKDQLKNYPDGVTYQWEISDNGTSGWRTVGTNASTLNYSITAARDYYFRVTVVGRDNSKVDYQTATGTSNVIHVKGVVAGAGTTTAAVYFTGNKLKGTQGAEIIANAVVTPGNGTIAAANTLIKLPEWADTSSGGILTYDWKVWDKTTDKSVPLAVSTTSEASVDGGTGYFKPAASQNVTGAVAGGQYELEITNVNYDKVKVQFLDGDNNDAVLSTGFSCPELNMVTGAAQSITYGGTATTGTVTLEYVSGLKAAPATASKTLDIATGSVAFFTAADEPTGEGYVKVRVKGLNSLTTPYEITVDDPADLSELNANVTNTLTLEAAPTQIEAGKTGKVTVVGTLTTQLDAATSGHKALKATIQAKDTAGNLVAEKTISFSNDVSDATSKMNSVVFEGIGKSVKFSVSAVTELGAPKVSAVMDPVLGADDWGTTNANTVTITFDSAVTCTNAAAYSKGTTGATLTVTTATPSSSVSAALAGTAVAADTSFKIAKGSLAATIDGVKVLNVADQYIVFDFDAKTATVQDADI